MQHVRNRLKLGAVVSRVYIAYSWGRRAAGGVIERGRPSL